MDKAFLKSPSRLALIACIVLASVMAATGIFFAYKDSSFTINCFSLSVAMMGIGAGQRYGAKLQERKIIESESLGNAAEK